MSLRGEHGPHTRPGRALLRLIAAACSLALMAPGAALATQQPSSAPGAPCSGSGASAQNQYCEDIPGAGGSQTPGSGSPTLRSTLPAPARARLLTGATRSRGGGSVASASSASTSAASSTKHSARPSKRAAINAVLNLPAAPRWSLGSAPASSASAIAPFTWLIALLAVLGLGAGVIGGLRHRRTPTT